MKPLPAPSIPQPEEEPQELARFRQEWLAELQSRKPATGNEPGPTSPDDAKPAVHGTSGSKTSVIPAALPPALPGPSTQTIAGIPSAITVISPASIHRASSTPLPPALRAAINVYRRAVEHEQRGELDDALSLYRQAFRMNPQVDRVYHREEMIASVTVAQQDPLHKPKSSDGKDALVDDLAMKVQRKMVLKPSGVRTSATTVTGTLASLLAAFPQDVSFEPEIEEESVPLRKLPDELLVMILKKLDPTSIERFAAISRKARLLALDSAIWRDLVKATYKPPQVPDIDNIVSVIERCFSDYRRVYIEHPRIRLDGVYIATCHYVRPGLSENSWVNISHLITYHRYLRFYSNGQVLSLLANEEHTPQQIIPILKPTLRMKGFFIGNWYLSGSTVHLSNLLDASGRFSLPGSDELPVHQPSESVEGNRYTFVMSLGLVSRPLGRWNKLQIESYDSVNIETGDINPVALKHERSFWFSKVRSYALY